MRYIDDMLREIPIEELLGNNEITEDNNEIRPVIPDAPLEYTVPAAEEKGKEQADEIKETTDAAERAKIIDSGAKVRSRYTGIIAAALAVVLGVGALTAYFGAVKHTGPLARFFTDSENSSDAESVELVDKKEADELQAKADEYAESISLEFVKCLRYSNNNYDFYKSDAGLTKFTVTDGELKDEINDRCNVVDFCEKFNIRELVPKNSQVIIGFNPRLCRIAVQWTSADGKTVGHFPDSLIDDHKGPYDATNEIQKLIVDDYDEYGVRFVKFKSYWGTNVQIPLLFGFSVDDANRLKAMLGEEITDLGKELYGVFDEFECSDGTVKETFSVSDRENADVIYNGKYYKAPEVLKVLHECADETTRAFGSTSEHTQPILEMNLYGLQYWYKCFLKENAQPVEDLGAKRLPDNMLYAVFDAEDNNGNVHTHSVVSSEYENANIVVDGKYYKIEDTSVFDILNSEIIEDKYRLGSYYTITVDRGEDKNPLYCSDYQVDSGSEWYYRILGAEKIEVTEFAYPKADDIIIKAKLWDQPCKHVLEVTLSDRVGADIIIDGKYYICEEAKELFKGRFFEEFSIGKDGLKYRGNAAFQANEWYQKFLASDPQPITKIDEEKDEDAPKYIVCLKAGTSTNGKPVIIRTSGYKYANIIINNMYYHIDDLDELINIIGTSIDE